MKPLGKNKRSRIITGLLLTFTLLALGTAAWLFLADARRDEPSTTHSSKVTTTQEKAESVLKLPNSDSPEGAESKDRLGEQRLDPKETISGSQSKGDSDDSSLDSTTDQPSVMRTLKERSIALAGASSAGPSQSTANKSVKIGNLRTECAGLTAPNRSKAEQDLLDRISSALTRAHALVTRSDLPPACTNDRIQRAANSSVLIVVRAGTAKDARVFAGRSSNQTNRPSRASVTLAAEVAAALDLKQVTQAKSGEALDLVTRSGAIETKAGPATILIEIDLRKIQAAELNQIALDVSTAMAVYLSRADSAKND